MHELPGAVSLADAEREKGNAGKRGGDRLESEEVADGVDGEVDRDERDEGEEEEAQEVGGRGAGRGNTVVKPAEGRPDGEEEAIDRLAAEPRLRAVPDARLWIHIASAKSSAHGCRVVTTARTMTARLSAGQMPPTTPKLERIKAGKTR